MEYFLVKVIVKQWIKKKGGERQKNTRKGVL
jgi:hypothetical protein